MMHVSSKRGRDVQRNQRFLHRVGLAARREHAPVLVQQPHVCAAPGQPSTRACHAVLDVEVTLEPEHGTRAAAEIRAPVTIFMPR